MKATNFRLLFFGSDRFSSLVLDKFVRLKICPLHVVTRPGSILDQYSAKNNLIRHTWPIKNEVWNRNDFNIGLVASFGNLIDVQTVGRFNHGLFNVHPSLLPRYRGSTPIQTAILDGQTHTGCTIMRIPPIEKFDIGDIVLQERLDIMHREYAVDLRDKLANLGASLAEQLFLDYDRHVTNTRPQSNEGKSYAKKIKPEQGLINFKTESADLIDRKMRAYTGFIDLYLMCLDGLKVRLEDIVDPLVVEKYAIDRLVMRRKDTCDVEAGAIYMHKTRQLLCIKCQDGKWVAFKRATPESKPKMSAIDFYNGYLSKVDASRLITDT